MVFNYANINHVLYPSNAGGKFLINCLSLNNRAVFQDQKLAQQQLNGNFTINDKQDYIYRHLELAKQTGKWTDLALGANQLFNIRYDVYINTFVEIVKKKLDTPVIQNCIANNLHLFTTVHDFIMLEHMLNIWPNGKLIVFKNYKNFVDKRLNCTDVKDKWDQIKGEDWPSVPDNIDSYNQLPKYIRNEIYKDFNNVIYDLLLRQETDVLWHIYMKKLSKTMDLFEFDVEYAYGNSENFYKTYVQVCNYLDLPTTEQIIIDRYYNEWKETINIIMNGKKQLTV